jgi:lipopolysaccharide/colanic/teichoic acid biosynthesis glycosyltransferase
MAFNRITFENALPEAANPGVITPRFARRTRLTQRERIMKRALDLLLAGTALFLALPMLGAIALALWLEDRGAVITKQRRVGEGGRGFTMFRFRTTINDNPQAPLTRVGELLDELYLNELPQLFNVLRGDMSLVGPRPELPQVVEQYEAWQRERFLVPQGITGWWQVGPRNGKAAHKSTHDDLFYIRNYSVWLDIRILLMTLHTLIHGRELY